MSAHSRQQKGGYTNARCTLGPRHVSSCRSRLSQALRTACEPAPVQRALLSPVGLFLIMEQQVLSPKFLVKGLGCWRFSFP